MHLVCINHVPCLIKRWCTQICKSTIHAIDECLDQLRLPHNFKVAYTDSIDNAGQLKARANRVFVLNVGIPIIALRIPSLYASHFLIYSMAIKILHSPESSKEIDFAERLMNYYCQTAPLIHGPSIELFSLHAHIHLAEQVRRHGGLVHTSAFAFESCIRYIERKAHGSKHVASQISYWIELQSMMKSDRVQIPQPTTVNVSRWFYRILSNAFSTYWSIGDQVVRFSIYFVSILGIDQCSFKLYLRYNKHCFVTYHTTIYDKPFKCRSFIVSFINTNDPMIQYGDIIVFIRTDSCVYALIQQYAFGDKSITDYVDIPVELHSKANWLFPFLQVSDRFLLIPVEIIRHKCVSVPVGDLFCLTEIRTDYEHDWDNSNLIIFFSLFFFRYSLIIFSSMMASSNVYAKNYSSRRSNADPEAYKLMLFPADNSIAVVKSKQCSPVEHDWLKRNTSIANKVALKCSLSRS